MLQQIRSRGLWFSFGVIFNRVVPAWLFRLRWFRVYELAADTSSVQDMPHSLSALRCDLVHHADLAVSLTRTDVGSWSSDAAECWLCQDQGEPIGGLWIGRNVFSERELGLEFVLGNDQCWMFSAYVQKDRRNAGAYRFLLGEVLERCRPAVIFCAINPVNHASMAAHRHRVRRTLGTVLAVRLLGSALCLSGGQIRPDRSISFACRTSPLRIDLSDVDR